MLTEDPKGSLWGITIGQPCSAGPEVLSVVRLKDLNKYTFPSSSLEGRVSWGS